MAKKSKSKSKSKKSSKVAPPPPPKQDDEQQNQEDDQSIDSSSQGDVGEKLTLAALDAISDSEDEGKEEDEWNAEAKALRQAIAEGAFDKLHLKPNMGKGEEKEEEEDDDEGKVSNKKIKLSKKVERQVVLQDDSSDDDEENSDESKRKENTTPATSKSNIKGLKSVTANLLASRSHLPWPETFDVVPSTPLPFGTKGEDGETIDVHDDLKREVIFYDTALEAVHLARERCEEGKVPFSRPVDFFAEMVKTDDHMAKVKDRLIFESKKMEAFEQRKTNREQKLRAKEAHAHRISEKHKAKKKHMKDVEDWAKTAASNRAGGGKVYDDDDEYLNRMGGGGGGGRPGKKRQAMNKKYGFGGKRGRFKQNDQKSMNDTSGFNPRGGSGIMGKSTATKRKGKRARDAARSRN